MDNRHRVRWSIDKRTTLSVCIADGSKQLAMPLGLLPIAGADRRPCRGRVQTVYFHFGNKRTVLKEAVVAAVGDDQPVPLLDRTLFRQLPRNAAAPPHHR